MSSNIPEDQVRVLRIIADLSMISVGAISTIVNNTGPRAGVEGPTPLLTDLADADASLASALRSLVRENLLHALDGDVKFRITDKGWEWLTTPD